MSSTEDSPLYIAPTYIEIMPLPQIYLIKDVADIVRTYSIPYFDAQFLQKALPFLNLDMVGICKGRIQQLTKCIERGNNHWREESDFFAERGVDIKNADALYEHIKTHPLSTDTDRVTLRIRDFMHRPDRKREPTRPDLSGKQLHSWGKVITIPVIFAMLKEWNSTLRRADYLVEGTSLISVCYNAGHSLEGQPVVGSSHFIVTIEVDIGENYIDLF